MFRWKQVNPGRLAFIGLLLQSLVACAPADYADGVKGFSQAVQQAATTEQALAAAAHQPLVDAWVADAQSKKEPVEFPVMTKCRPVGIAYHSGDCLVKLGGTTVPANTKPTMTSMTKYATLLGAVVDDKTCSTLQTDSKDLATSTGDIAKAVKDTTFAAEASPLFTIVSTIGCVAIETLQIRILRQATTDADPLIASTDADLQAEALDQAGHQLLLAQARYSRTRSATDLEHAVAIGLSLDQAQLTPAGPTVLKLATLHGELTEDLQARTVNLARVKADAQSFISSALAIASAANTLANPTASK
jgi:hypothetical protein